MSVKSLMKAMHGSERINTMVGPKSSTRNSRKMKVAFALVRERNTIFIVTAYSQ